MRDGITSQSQHHLSLSLKDTCPLLPLCCAGQTGYHPAGGLSRYNSHREGVVFSNGELLDLGITEVEVANFREKAGGWFDAIADIAIAALNEAAVAAGLPGADADTVPKADDTDDTDDTDGQPASASSASSASAAAAAWVASLGDIRSASQWHVKRYTAATTATATVDDTVDDTGTPQPVLLPLHTDPSLISVVIHDAPGTNPGCLGLQHRSAARGGYVELPHHGHAVATVLVGSLLEKISCGLFSASKHRVLMHGGDVGDGGDGGNGDTEQQLPPQPPPPSSVALPGGGGGGGGGGGVRHGPEPPTPQSALPLVSTFTGPPAAAPRTLAARTSHPQCLGSDATHGMRTLTPQPTRQPPPTYPQPTRLGGPPAARSGCRPRMAATFFFRPGPNYVLRSMPSPVVRARPNSKNFVEMPYAEWKRRTAARYEASKKRQKPPEAPIKAPP